MKIQFFREGFIAYVMTASIMLFIFHADCVALGAVDEVRLYLTNGDRISGVIVVDENDYLVLKNVLFGNVKIKKTLVEKREKAATKEIAKPAAKEPKLWKAEISLGVGVSEGNTVKSSYAGDFYANRKTVRDEFTLKGSGFYASTKRNLDTEKWYGMVRYAYSFWDRKWYNFYKFESDHDKFANIYFRLLPSTGVGYWFSKDEDFKALAELAVGYENTYLSLFNNSNLGRGFASRP